MAKASRIRTESMIDRLGRKPLSEGYELWDKDYMLGALRLFQCKLEVAPPFEQAACLDAVGDILTGIEEADEAREHYMHAVVKYRMINKNALAKLMECKMYELTEGHTTEDTIQQVEKALAELDGKGGAALGRVHLYHAELLRMVERNDEALAAVTESINLDCERKHLAHGVKGDILMTLDRGNDAIAAYQDAIEEKDCFVPAYESLIRVFRSEGREEEALEVIDAVMKLHPKAVLLRDKAFILSNLQKDQDALDCLNEAIENPPQEETEQLSDSSLSRQLLLKAKAAILADLGTFPEALQVLTSILENDPNEEEALMMKKDIEQMTA
eukprot:TRINITY_DN335_c0_g1_i1.p1 TRINITY_DN335_c0_g1~~TRINITY_DN335_c0_g1_i1.p1  ORF type:complete len:328 (+),score=130.99 TRINITY_DN335_c0_g1_i1:59-1042(+)